MNVVEIVRSHYVKYWGEPSREAEFSTQDDHIEIYKWDASEVTEGVTMYATLGGSATDMPGIGHGHRVEYVVALQPSRDDIVQELAGLGIYARQKGVTIDHGHTVPGDGPMWAGASMSSFLILQPNVEIFPTLSLASGVHIEFLQAIPIFESERQFKIKHGAQALLERWEKAQVPFWDPRRRSNPA